MSEYGYFEIGGGLKMREEPARDLGREEPDRGARTFYPRVPFNIRGYAGRRTADRLRRGADRCARLSWQRAVVGD